MRSAAPAFGLRRPAPVVRPSMLPYTSRPIPAAPVDPHVVAPPAGPASGPPPLHPGPAAGEVPGRNVLLDELGAIDPALAKSLIDAGVAVTTTVATEAPKWSAQARAAKREKHRRHARPQPREREELAPPPPPPAGGIGWMHVGVGVLLLAAIGGAVYAFTRPRAPVRIIREEAA